MRHTLCAAGSSQRRSVIRKSCGSVFSRNQRSHVGEICFGLSWLLADVENFLAVHPGTPVAFGDDRNCSLVVRYEQIKINSKQPGGSNNGNSTSFTDHATTDSGSPLVRRS
jgi:hypothetical protein